MGRINDKKNILIIFLLVVVLVMSVGFALLGSNLEVTAVGTVAGEWSIKFANAPIVPIEKTDGVKEVSTQLDTNGLKLTLNTSFEKPGDKITYEFKVENTGSIDAYLKDLIVEGKSGNTEVIKLSYEVKSNDKLLTYAKGYIIGETASKEITPSVMTSLLNRQLTNGETVTPQYNYLTVTMEYLESATISASTESATYTLTLQYEQTSA